MDSLKFHKIIAIMSLVVVILLCYAMYKKSEYYSNQTTCAEPMTRAYNGFRCIEYPDFQTKCVEFTLANGTVTPDQAEAACRTGDAYYWSVNL